MKKIIILLMVLVPYCLTAQTTYSNFDGHYDIMTFFGDNGFGNGGFTITTNIPTNERHNATVYVKGFDNVSRTIGLQVSWFYSGDEFTDYAASSTGAWIPERTTLDKTGEFIQIHFEGFSDVQNLEITALSERIYDPAWFTGWTMNDGGGDGVEVRYTNRFEETFTKNLYSEGVVNGANSTITNNLIVGQGINTGTISISGNAIIGAGGKLGIGFSTGNPAVPLHTKGGVRFEGVKDGIPNDQILSTDGSGNLTLVNKGGYWQPHTNASTIVYNGVIGIGMSNTASISTAAVTAYNFKLLVGGAVGARKVRVTAVTDWADYVFADDYKLQPLTEVEKFVKANKHLEGVPTEKEVKENGVDLGDTQVILLKKIEELTLHLIELSKQLKQQDQTLIEQDKKIKLLENKIK